MGIEKVITYKAETKICACIVFVERYKELKRKDYEKFYEFNVADVSFIYVFTNVCIGS